MEPMQVEVVAQGAWQVVDVAGVVDVATAPRLREVLQEAQLAGDRVLLDLDRVELLDSFGLGIVVGAYKRARMRGSRLELVVTRERLRRVFVLTGLDTVLTLHEQRSAAVE